MTRDDLIDTELPDTPGVYFFKDGRGSILYIGKATSLRERVKSYFSADLHAARGPAIVLMVEKARRVTWEETDSVLEALILEAHLIKKHQPTYNSREKDNKSFNYVVITNEAFPQVLVVRARELATVWDADDIKYTFGPFPQGGQFREAMRLIRKLFPFRDAKCTPGQGKPCFNYQIGLCPGVCIGAVTKTEYGRTIQHLRLFFEGKKTKLIERLERDMARLAGREEFEKAAARRRTLFGLRHINDVSLLKRDFARNAGAQRIEGYDIAHTRGSDVVGVMSVVAGGETQKHEYRKFRIRMSTTGGDVPALTEVLERRLRHGEWGLPHLIVMDGGKAQVNAAKRALAQFGYAIPVVGVVKDESHRPREIIGADRAMREQFEHDILLANSEAHRFAQRYHDELRTRRMRR